MSRPPPGQRADYAAWITQPVRWADIDALGHVNNAAYLSIMDTAISLWQCGRGWPATGPGALRLVAVETGCRYHREITFPSDLDCGIRLGHLGRSSLRYEVGLFVGDTAHAEGFMAMVLTGADGRPTPIPDAPRTDLMTLHPDRT